MATWTGTKRDEIKIGTSEDDIFNGGGGADTIRGGGGNDTITYQNDKRNTILDGGIGTDTLVVNQSASINLSSANQDTGSSNVTLTGFENVNGAGSTGVLNLTGTSSANVLTGGSAADIIVGGGGADTLAGGAGNDRITYQNDAAGTVIDGGTGIDTLVLNQSASIDLTAVDQDIGSANVTVNGFENVSAINAASPVVLTGSSGANQLTGGSGNDVLVGGGGQDTLSGGAGNDIITYQNTQKGTVIDG
ncbi:MAG: calcium-binding protein, partial [Burkholderiaceae bacterium]